jgi:hypothetical protein
MKIYTYFFFLSLLINISSCQTKHFLLIDLKFASSPFNSFQEGRYQFKNGETIYIKYWNWRRDEDLDISLTCCGFATETAKTSDGTNIILYRDSIAILSPRKYPSPPNDSNRQVPCKNKYSNRRTTDFIKENELPVISIEYFGADGLKCDDCLFLEGQKKNLLQFSTDTMELDSGYKFRCNPIFEMNAKHWQVIGHQQKKKKAIVKIQQLKKGN